MGAGKERQLYATFVASSVVVVVCVQLWRFSNFPQDIIIGGLALVAVLVAMATLDILRYNPADSHTLYTLIGQYLDILRMRVLFPFGRWRLYKISTDCKKVQEQTLMKILQSNSNTNFGRDHDLARFRTRQEFVDGFPLTAYDNYTDYMDKVTSGGQNVLTTDKVVFLATTSGTTGKYKIFPLTDTYIKSLKRCLTLRHCMFGMFYTLKRVHQFRLAVVDRFSSCGLPLGGAGVITQFPKSYNLVPFVYLKLFEEAPSYYVQSLYLLTERELGYILGYSSDLLYALFKYMEAHWDELCEVIETGKVSSSAPFDDVTKEEIYVTADPARADELRREFHAGVKGLGKRIWRDLAFVMVGRTGSFVLCSQILAETYLEGIPLQFLRHASTEGIYGFQVQEDLGSDIYTLVPDISFLEFIKTEDADTENPETFFMEQLEIGKTYEIVATSPHGVYRFRIGDVIKIVGFYNSLPRYVFQFRTGQRLNIAFDRTPDHVVYKALQKTFKLLPPDVVLIDYTATESMALDKIKGERPQEAWYVFFLEVAKGQQQCPLPAEFITQFDQELREMHEPYNLYRTKGNIAPLQVIQVRLGTFDQLKRHLWGEYQNTQFKQPRVQRREDLLRFLLQQQI